MRYFSHHNATSLPDAIGAASGEEKTLFLAGGTDLVGVLKDDLLAEYPAKLVNLKSLPGMDTIETSVGQLRLGALASLTALVEDPLVAAHAPALRAAARSVATPEIRNTATLGGNLCQDTRCWYYRYPHHMGGRMICARKGKGPCYAVRGDNRYHAVIGGKKCFAPTPSDTAVALAALGASLTLSGPEGERSLPVEELYTPMGPALGRGELVTTVEVPLSGGASRQGFRKFTVRKPVDFAVVSVAADLRLDGDRCRSARIFLGGVAPAPHRAAQVEEALVGGPLTADAVLEAAELALTGAKPLSRNGYKVRIAKALVGETLLELLG